MISFIKGEHYDLWKAVGMEREYKDYDARYKKTREKIESIQAEAPRVDSPRGKGEGTETKMTHFNSFEQAESKIQVISDYLAELNDDKFTLFKQLTCFIKDRGVRFRAENFDEEIARLRGRLNAVRKNEAFKRYSNQFPFIKTQASKLGVNLDD